MGKIQRTMNIQKQIEQTEKKLEELKKQLKAEQDKNTWVDIGNKMQITNKQQYNGKIYAEILKEVKEEEIADYPLLQRLRNSGKFDFLKTFWVFVPNPDEVSKKNNHVARFGANSDRAGLNCDRNPDYRNDALGVFLIKRKSGKLK